MNNTCICCGEVIPEGRQVCINCEEKLSKNYTPYDGIDYMEVIKMNKEKIITKAIVALVSTMILAGIVAGIVAMYLSHSIGIGIGVGVGVTAMPIIGVYWAADIINRYGADCSVEFPE